MDLVVPTNGSGSGTLSSWESAGGAACPAAPTELRVLLVDSERLSRLIVGNLFRRSGYRVTVAGTGAETVAHLNAEEFHLVFMDRFLPDVDGLLLVTRIRADPRFATVPIIVMASTPDAEDALQCLLAGAEECLVKPVSQRDVQHMWQHVWRRAQLASSAPHLLQLQAASSLGTASLSLPASRSPLLVLPPFGSPGPRDMLLAPSPAPTLRGSPSIGAAPPLEPEPCGSADSAPGTATPPPPLAPLRAPPLPLQLPWPPCSGPLTVPGAEASACQTCGCLPASEQRCSQCLCSADGGPGEGIEGSGRPLLRAGQQQGEEQGARGNRAASALQEPPASVIEQQEARLPFPAAAPLWALEGQAEAYSQGSGRQGVWAACDSTPAAAWGPPGSRQPAAAAPAAEAAGHRAAGSGCLYSPWRGRHEQDAQRRAAASGGRPAGSSTTRTPAGWEPQLQQHGVGERTGGQEGWQGVEQAAGQGVAGAIEGAEWEDDGRQAVVCAAASAGAALPSIRPSLVEQSRRGGCGWAPPTEAAEDVCEAVGGGQRRCSSPWSGQEGRRELEGARRASPSPPCSPPDPVPSDAEVEQTRGESSGRAGAPPGSAPDPGFVLSSRSSREQAALDTPWRVREARLLRQGTVSSAWSRGEERQAEPAAAGCLRRAAGEELLSAPGRLAGGSAPQRQGEGAARRGFLGPSTLRPIGVRACRREESLAAQLQKQQREAAARREEARRKGDEEGQGHRMRSLETDEMNERQRAALSTAVPQERESTGGLAKANPTQLHPVATDKGGAQVGEAPGSGPRTSRAVQEAQRPTAAHEHWALRSSSNLHGGQSDCLDSQRAAEHEASGRKRFRAPDDWIISQGKEPTRQRFREAVELEQVPVEIESTVEPTECQQMETPVSVSQGNSPLPLMSLKSWKS